MKGEVSTNIDLKFKVGTKVVDGKSVFTATITYLKTDTDISLLIAKSKVNITEAISEDIKKEIEEKILDAFLQKKLQKVIDKAIQNLS